LFFILFFTSVNLLSQDLNLLRVLHAMLEERSVARTAARLHVTSPAVSNALARLRAGLGDALFVRKGRGLTPTPRALELAPTLATTFANLERALAQVPFEPQTSTRVYSLALSDTDQLSSLSAIARAFARSLPNARLDILSIDTLISSGGLDGSSIDAAIIPPGPPDGAHVRPLYEDEAVFVVRKRHPRIRRRLTPALFNAEGHVDVHLVLGKAGTGHRAAEDAFARHGLSRRVTVTVPSFAAAATVVAATDLLAGMPRRVATVLARSLPLDVLLPPMPALRFPMMLVWHERTHHDAAAAFFRDVIADALATPLHRGER
jgi:DNA-binding transcriptional LysR family regulator